MTSETEKRNKMSQFQKDVISFLRLQSSGGGGCDGDIPQRLCGRHVPGQKKLGAA